MGNRWCIRKSIWSHPKCSQSKILKKAPNGKCDIVFISTYVSLKDVTLCRECKVLIFSYYMYCSQAVGSLSCTVHYNLSGMSSSLFCEDLVP